MAIARIEHNAAINKDSEKKILKTSIFLAPIARKTPISLFLEEIETEIKLSNINAAKIPKPTPTHKNTFFKMIIMDTTIFAFS